MRIQRAMMSLILFAVSATTLAHCHECPMPWQIGGRVLAVVPKGSSDRLPAFGGGTLDDFSNAAGLDVNLSYHYTPNIVTEFSLATSRHSVEACGATIPGVGRVSLVMPSLTVHYHFCPFGRFDPYLGVGLNYTFFYDSDKGPVDRVRYGDSLGFVGQIGMDICLTERLSLNLDLKKTYIDTTLRFEANGLRQNACVRFNPWTFGLGLNYRF